MSWIVDGSNLLGRSGMEREAVEEKRRLVQALAGFARRSSKRVVCVFDGAPPAAFGSTLGSLKVLFSHPRTADDLIVELATGNRAGGSVTVVTSDRGLASRIAGRRVKIFSCEAFRGELQGKAEGEKEAAEEGWENYFADPKNRNVF